MERALLWSEAFAVGHRGLDDEHRGLIAAINALDAALSGGGKPKRLDAMLGQLSEAAAAHLAHEDRVLREIKSRSDSYSIELKAMSLAALNLHLARHERALRELDTLLGREPQQAGVPLADLPEELRNWFVQHAVKDNAPLKSLFQALEARVG